MILQGSLCSWQQDSTHNLFSAHSITTATQSDIHAGSMDGYPTFKGCSLFAEVAGDVYKTRGIQLLRPFRLRDGVEAVNLNQTRSFRARI